MAFVYNDQKIFWKVVEKCRRVFPGRPAGQVPRIVFNSMTIAYLQHHFQVKSGPLLNALGLQQFVQRTKIGDMFFEFLFYLPDCPLSDIHSGYVMGRRIYRYSVEGFYDLTGQGVNFLNVFNHIPEKTDANGPVLFMYRINVQDISPDTKTAPVEVSFTPLILDLYKLLDCILPCEDVLFFNIKEHIVVRLWRAQTVYARYTGHNDHILTVKQGPCGGMPHFVYLLIDAGVLLDVSV